MPTQGAIIIAPKSFLVLVCGEPIDDWPQTGTAAELARIGPLSTHTAGFGSDVFVLGVPQWSLTLNVQIGSRSDNWLELCSTAFEELRKPWSVSASREGQSLFSTIIAGPTAEPPIVLSTSEQPMRSWVIGLKLAKRPTGGAFVVKAALTKAEVQEFQA
jgi:hypothetical protein